MTPAERASIARTTDQAHAAVENPQALAKAARIVRAALARQALILDDRTSPPPRPGRAAQKRGAA